MIEDADSPDLLERESSQVRDVIVRGIRAHFSFAALLASSF